MAKAKCFHGIRKVCSDTKSLHGYYSGEYIEVFYDKNADRIWSIYHWSLGHNQWTKYDDPDIVRVGIICIPCTMRDLKDFTLEALEHENNPW